GHLGRLVEPLRLARRRRLPLLGLPDELPLARTRRDAAGGGPARALLGRRRHRDRGPQPLLEPFPRAPRRARARRVRGLHARRRARGALSLAGAAAEAAPRGGIA